LHFETLPSFVLQRKTLTDPVEVGWGSEKGVIRIRKEIEELPDWVLDYFQSEGFEADRYSLFEAAHASDMSYSDFVALREFLSKQHDSSELISFPEWLTRLRDVFPVLFVTDQRLVVDSQQMSRSSSGPLIRSRRAHRDAGRPFRRAVEAASRDISERMRRVDSDYARVSQRQDRLFPRDVLSAMRHQETVSEDELRSLLHEVETRRGYLRDVGLLDRDLAYEPKLAAESIKEESVRPVIATFLRSTLTKYEVLEDLSNRLRIFKTFLDERFSPKEMIIDRREGLRFSLPDGSKIPPSKLSSGEQQMMVLAYEILFRAEPGTLVMIDEPEISLHVLWQDTLIDSLTDMAKPNRLQFLMATHSPVIVASHPEFEYSLDMEFDG
jgi:hypothetical protein